MVSYITPLLKDVQKALRPLWVNANLKGSCWTVKDKGFGSGGNAIVLARGTEFIVVFRGEKGIMVRKFLETETTKLGKEALELLKQAGLLPDAESNDIIPDFNYVWGCEVCGKKGGGNLDEGYDFPIFVKALYAQHAEASPKCDPKNVVISDREGRKYEGTMRFAASTGVSVKDD